MDLTGAPNRRNPVVSSAGEVIPLELVIEYWFMVRVRLSAIDCSSVGIMLNTQSFLVAHVDCCVILQISFDNAISTPRHFDFSTSSSCPLSTSIVRSWFGRRHHC